MSINMLHQLITTTIHEVNAVFKEHTRFLPTKSLMDSTEDEEELNKARPEGAPQVRNHKRFVNTYKIFQVWYTVS